VPRPPQLELFGAPPAPEPAPVGAARPDPADEDVAARLPPGLRLGTSSWAFPGWSGLVYDRPAPEAALAHRGLAAYARHPLLRAVGLDRTFYATIPAEAFARHAADVPDGFRFLVKAAQACTFPALAAAGGVRPGPNPRFLDPGFAADEVIAPAALGLGAKLGVILFQLPPLALSARRPAEALLDRLAAFLDRLPRGPRYAVELRSRALLVPRWAEALAAAGAAHAYTVHPSMPAVAAQAEVVPPAAQPLLVVRWMLGHGRAYDEARAAYAPFDRLAAPDPASRAEIATLCRLAARAGREGIVVVNNKAEGSAPRSVAALARAVAG
jgi:uncharacterized protein YecE (DUF72 family)